MRGTGSHQRRPRTDQTRPALESKSHADEGVPAAAGIRQWLEARCQLNRRRRCGLLGSGRNSGNLTGQRYLQFSRVRRWNDSRDR